MPSIRLVVLLIIVLPGALRAQTEPKPNTSVAQPQTKPQSKPPKSPAHSRPPEIEDPALAQKRAIAIGSLRTLAIEARSYRDEALRARVQARIADALWDADQDGARTLFRRAWEAAEVFETRADEPRADVPGRVSANRSAATRQQTNLRSEILKLAAARDQTLGDEFLKKLAAARTKPGEPSDSRAISDSEIRERLRLANEFLESGNVPRAIQVSTPAFARVTRSAVSFLIDLRSHNDSVADQRFIQLLNRASLDPSSDANTVSLLTRYAFTPWIDLTVSPEGIPSSNSYPSQPAYDLPAFLKPEVLRVFAGILLKPFAALDQSSAGRAGTYFIAARLLPLFQQYAPELAPAISAQLNALGPEAARAALNAGDRSLSRGMTQETAGHNFSADLEERLQQARTADERDRAYAFAAMGAAEAGDEAALDFLNKIEDLETRKGIRSFVDYSLFGGYLKKNKVDAALALVRKSDLPRAVRASALEKIAEVVMKTDRVRGNELIEEALVESRRIDNGSNERAYVLVSLLNQFARFNPVRAWELASETVKAGNNAPQFTGENGMTRWELEGKFSIQVGTSLAGPTDLAESFTALARDDFYQAMDVGRNFTGEAPRALVTIAVARGVLEEQRFRSSSPTVRKGVAVP
ncbi:MAG TPA: hypothetical protein VJU86_05295 [Pyrinomonadaceae bacterium]|nr:hypothetical protein [Pyrinomonadaceae bacterium]